jgi:hypothetical protein
LLRDCARRGMRALRSWRWATAHSGSGARYGRCSRRPESSAVGSTRSPTFSTRYRSPRIPVRRRPWPRSGTPRTAGMHSTPRRRSQPPIGAKFPKATAKITDDLGQLLAFYDYPAEHWIHLRTTNPIESTFATVRHRTKITCGPGSRAAGLAMAFKLIEAAQDRWRAVNAPHLVGSRPRRRDLHQRQARRATRRTPTIRSRLKIFIHRSLTIARRVNFKIADPYGAEVAEHVSVLVPAHALRPRGRARNARRQ